ncbi:Hypothetical predicted protein [Pelobates cultripes]|uniref:Uncharacterized protein n=1 Tax=Pelobates cultripes TaxID=61616 RepID=A0AAD1SZ69_PELCU|nr:Hypothetical predicted protein [Pelobates cultripes]
MAPVSPASSSSDQEQPMLADIGAEIRCLASTMVTKADLQSLTSTLTAFLTSAVTALRTQIDVQGGRIKALEAQAQTMRHQTSAADTALTHRQVEDLDNRSRCSNIRVRGVPEQEGTENAEVLLTGLFRQILGEKRQWRYTLNRRTGP